MTTTIPTVSTTSGPPPSAPALTTTFTPASTCTNDFYMLPYQASGFACMVGDESSPCQYLHLGPSNASGCMPPDWSTATNAYYSPGVCPTGYTEACSNLVSVGTVTETRATCCPSSYACQTETYWPWYANNGCTKVVNTTEVYTYTTDDPDDGLVTTTSKDKYGVNAYAVTIRYQSADQLPPATSATTTPSSPTSTTSQTQSATSSPSSGGLSTGAKAGIGVGVAAGVIIVLVALGFWLFRRRRANSDAAAGTAETQNLAESSPFDQPELGGTQIHPMAELAGNQPYPGQTVAHHVPAPEPVELGTGRE